MNLLKKEVVHKTLGVGHVVSFDGKIITVQFGERSVKFSFPSIFNDILSMKDPALQNEVKELCDHENNQINQQQEERMTEFEQRFAASIDAKANKAKNTKKYKDNNNVAIKCNYCDGGRSDQAFGYKSLCSDEVLHQNVSVIKRPWCSSAECECKKYSLGEINRTELERMNRNGKFICYESRLLKDWIASVGRVQREKRTDKPKKTVSTRVNRMCILTTKLPTELEQERKVFAAFLISEVENGDEAEGNMHAHPDYRIELTAEEAERVRFWEFHKNKTKMEMPFWGSGLTRNLTDAQSINIMKAMMEAAIEPAKKAHILEVLEYYCKVTAAAAAK